MPIHGTTAIRVVASLASSCLVIASAGFGAVYAYRIGIQHSTVLAGLTVLFAVALEIIKPLAVVACFDAFRSWSPVRALALGILAAMGITYSLTAELALTASSRSDLVAQRQGVSDASQRAKERYQRASQELAALRPTKTVGELEAAIARQSTKGCGVANWKGTWVCPVHTSLLSELARAKKRQELEAIIHEADQAMAGSTAVHIADPGSTALTTYLGSVGVQVSTETVGQWLTLVPVLALELGSALAFLLVGSIPAPTKEPEVIRPLTPITARDEVARKIVDHLKNHGGSLSLAERNLAKVIGADRNTMRRAIHQLGSVGLITHQPTKRGTTLTLVA